MFFYLAANLIINFGNLTIKKAISIQKIFVFLATNF